MIFSISRITRNMSIALILSTIIGRRSSRWLIIWGALEFNTLAICYIIVKEINKEKEKLTPVIEYIVIQEIASTILLLASIIPPSKVRILALTSSLLIKIGAWPLHLWYTNFLQTLKIRSIRFLLITTWQKLLPLTIIFSRNLEDSWRVFFLARILGRRLSPLLSINKIQTTKIIIILISLNGNGWLLLTTLTSPRIFFIFFTIYRITILLTLKFLEIIKNKNRVRTTSWETIVIIRNLRGLPPMAIFWAKSAVLIKTMSLGLSQRVAVILVIVACVLAYYILWTGLNRCTVEPKKTQLILQKEREKYSTLAVQLSAISLLWALLLGLTLIGYTLMGCNTKGLNED